MVIVSSFSSIADSIGYSGAAVLGVLGGLEFLVDGAKIWLGFSSFILALMLISMYPLGS